MSQLSQAVVASGDLLSFEDAPAPSAPRHLTLFIQTGSSVDLRRLALVLVVMSGCPKR